MKNAWFFSLILCWLTAGCGGGGAHSSTDEITATISTTEPEIDYIFGRVQNFEGARATAYAIDVNSGALSLIDPEEALYRFLSKQPDIAASDILMPNGEESYGALTHLYHDVGTAPNQAVILIAFTKVTRGISFYGDHKAARLARLLITPLKPSGIAVIVISALGKIKPIYQLKMNKRIFP